MPTRGHTIQSVFFDYDRDGDLDLYVGNYPPSGFQQNSDFFAQKMKVSDPSESDKLYRNEGDHFVDATQAAGVLNYGLTLGLSVADFNHDGWPDLYVSNDFNSSDYLYINQQDGSFANELTTYTGHTSNFGMGTDAADINNDGLTDLIQLDMMGSTNEQQKANMSAMNPEAFYATVDRGLHYQYMKNTLQLNTGQASFMDVGELAGVAYTDWSWGALLMDMNNDGHKDIFITNGMRRDVNNNDFNALFRIQKAYNIRLNRRSTWIGFGRCRCIRLRTLAFSTTVISLFILPSKITDSTNGVSVRERPTPTWMQTETWTWLSITWTPRRNCSKTWLRPPLTFCASNCGGNQRIPSALVPS